MDMVLQELKAYGKALEHKDRLVYEKLLNQSLKHISKISYASSMHVWAFILLSIIMEQEKKYEILVDGLLQSRKQDKAVDQGR